MRTVLALMDRNRKLFFKDKGMLFTSMITPVILIVLYATFLAKVFRDSFTAVFVISLKVILWISFSSSFSAFDKCQEIASPSRSGSVARYTLSDFFTDLRSAARISPFPRMVIYFGS